MLSYLKYFAYIKICSNLSKLEIRSQLCRRTILNTNLIEHTLSCNTLHPSTVSSLFCQVQRVKSPLNREHLLSLRDETRPPFIPSYAKRIAMNEGCVPFLSNCEACTYECEFTFHCRERLYQSAQKLREGCCRAFNYDFTNLPSAFGASFSSYFHPFYTCGRPLVSRLLPLVSTPR